MGLSYLLVNIPVNTHKLREKWRGAYRIEYCRWAPWSVENAKYYPPNSSPSLGFGHGPKRKWSAVLHDLPPLVQILEWDRPRRITGMMGTVPLERPLVWLVSDSKVEEFHRCFPPRDLLPALSDMPLCTNRILVLAKRRCCFRYVSDLWSPAVMANRTKRFRSATVLTFLDPGKILSDSLPFGTITCEAHHHVGQYTDFNWIARISPPVGVAWSRRQSKPQAIRGLAIEQEGRLAVRSWWKRGSWNERRMTRKDRDSRISSGLVW